MKVIKERLEAEMQPSKWQVSVCVWNSNEDCVAFGEQKMCEKESDF